MLNHYLQETAYRGTSVAEVENSFRELSKITGDAYPDEFFCMNVNFYTEKVSEKTTMMELLYGPNSQFDKNLLHRVVPFVFGRFNTSYGPYLTIGDFKKAVQNGKKHYFLGAKFKNKLEHEIETHAEYLLRRTDCLRNSLTGRNCTIILPKLLSKVKLTANGYEMLATVAGFKRVCNDIITLDDYVNRYWTDGGFSIRDVQRTVGIDISNESDSVKTNKDLRALRHFFINQEIGWQYCYYHIKIGDTRMYIYPDISNRNIYIPYIGRHLPTQLY